MDKLIETFCDVDDFCQLFIEQWQQQLVQIIRDSGKRLILPKNKNEDSIPERF
ncbi:hypothetical protein QNF03_002511 [Vibrio cidicii]|uniref:hypothetical protein n=1 Tax=Vibrio TaxID=662 RepID=UPI000A5B4333|nr:MULTISPECIES: hypothetical protein [Vibrio]ELV8625850.1 hypothetical protein [Vibrio cidicii]